jgi:hypothetical protein
VKTFISLTWTEGVNDHEAKTLVRTVAEMVIRIGERIGPWFQSQMLPTLRPFGDWVILAMPRGSAYSSVDWYLDHCRSADGQHIDGPAYLRLIELEPWQSSTPHFDVALVAEDLAGAEGQSALNVALPGLAAVISAHQVRRLASQEAQMLALRHLVAHALGRATGIPLPNRATDITAQGDQVYCTNVCAMRPCMHLRHLLEYGMEGASRPHLYCDACERDLEATLVGSHYGLN